MNANPGVLNVAAYKFVQLGDLTARKQALRDRALSCGLRGTVLLAEEGINLFLAGQPEAVHDFMQTLQDEDALRGMEVKYSQADVVPFKRLEVKIKREIVRMNDPTVRPDRKHRATAVDAHTLARWLDQGCDDAGRPVVMLDTRNAFEVAMGRFVGAIDWSLKKFSDFPQALDAHANELQDKTVVSYCTGGIRCEKAAMLMQAKGLTHVYQLDGGILRYFESLGLKDLEGLNPQGKAVKHWQGSCFVFDERVALDAQLAPVSPPCDLTS
jgi:UPF0176 protein